MQTLRQDLRYALRKLAQKPGFTVMVVLILAIGIGANAAVFSVVNSVVLAPLSDEDPGRLIVIKETNPTNPTELDSVSPGNFLDLHAQAPIFDSVTAWYDTAGAAGFSGTTRLLYPCSKSGES